MVVYKHKSVELIIYNVDKFLSDLHFAQLNSIDKHRSQNLINRKPIQKN